MLPGVARHRTRSEGPVARSELSGSRVVAVTMTPPKARPPSPMARVGGTQRSVPLSGRGIPDQAERRLPLVDDRRTEMPRPSRSAREDFPVAVRTGQRPGAAGFTASRRRGNACKDIKDARRDHIAFERLGTRQIPFDVGGSGEATPNRDSVGQARSSRRCRSVVSARDIVHATDCSGPSRSCECDVGGVARPSELRDARRNGRQLDLG